MAEKNTDRPSGSLVAKAKAEKAKAEKTAKKKSEESTSSTVRESFSVRKSDRIVLWGGVALMIAAVVVLVVSLLIPRPVTTETPGATTGVGTSTGSNSGLSGKSIDEDRKDAMQVAADLLTAGAVNPTGEDVEARLKKMSDGDESVFDRESMDQHIRMVDAYVDSEDLRDSVYQSVVTLASVLIGDNKTAEPVSDVAYREVFVDQEAGVAFVPGSVFTGSSVPFSLEMVYVDGEWKMSPYSLMESIKLSAMYNEGS